MTIETRWQTCQPRAGQRSRRLENAIRARVGRRNEQWDRLTLQVREAISDEKQLQTIFAGQPAKCRLVKKVEILTPNKQ